MLLAAVVLSLAVIASAENADGGSPARAKACVLDNIPKFDDRVSPAKDIAAAVAEACRNEIEAWIYSRPVSPGDDPARMHARLFAHFLEGEEFAPLVLQSRAAHISGQQLMSAPRITTNNDLVKLCQASSQADRALCLTYLKAWMHAYVWEAKRCFNSTIRNEDDLRQFYITNATLFPAKTAKEIGDMPPGVVLTYVLNQNTHSCQ